MKDDLYVTWIGKALLSYQMLEEALKLCIGVSYEIICASNPSEVDFKFSYSSINNAPLGSLIRMFSNVSKNETLVSDLKSKDVIRWRNFCAHNAFMHEFMNRTSQSFFSQHSVEEIKRVALYTGELVLKVGEELKKLQDLHMRTHSDRPKL